MIVSARLSGFAPHAGAPPARFGQRCTSSLLLRRCTAAFAKRFQFQSTLLKRVTDGVEQTFAVLPPRNPNREALGQASPIRNSEELQSVVDRLLEKTAFSQPSPLSASGLRLPLDPVTLEPREQ